MSVKILTNSLVQTGRGHYHQQLEGGGYEHYGVGAWNATDTTGFLPTGGLKQIEFFVMFPAGQYAAGGPGNVYTFPFEQIAAVAASSKFQLPPSPVAGTISLADFVVATTVATDAANIWTIGVVNKTQTQTIVDITAAINSNNSTGGQAFTAFTAVPLTIGTGATLAVAVGDVIEVTFTKASSAANLVELAFNLSMIVTGAGAVERFEFNDAANVNATTGAYTVVKNSGVYSIPVSRPSFPTPTSGAKFWFLMKGKS